ncbi:hypothetical protein NL676_010282 [Syzygium grande]|nr:hypothetical protein NL676_010282 [Syzygium grande]
MASTSRRTPHLLLVAAAAALLVAAGSAVLAGAQTPATQTCASKLVPCADYLNSTSPPPDTCCNPIRETVKTDRACLCNLYNTPGLLASLGINVTQALQLTKECGVSTDTSSCNATATPPSSSTTPPATPGGDSDAGRIAWSGILSLFLILASMIASIFFNTSLVRRCQGRVGSGGVTVEDWRLLETTTGTGLLHHCGGRRNGQARLLVPRTSGMCRAEARGRSSATDLENLWKNR